MLSIPGYSIIKPIGHGGFSDVFLARAAYPEGAAEIALKISREPGDLRLFREASALRRLGPPNTPAYLAVGHTSAERSYLAMEFLGSDSLASRLESCSRLSFGDARAYFLALCDAVERVHSVGIIHRDLKPSNVFFRSNGQAALIDFGIAQLTRGELPEETRRLTRTGETIGTSLYMAPEQWQGRHITDERTDIYALGIIAFELLTGRRPFEGDVAALRSAHMSRRCPAPSTLSPPWSDDPTLDARAIDETVLSCVAKRPDDRFLHVSELAASFRLATRPRAGKSAPGTRADAKGSAIDAADAADAARTTAQLADRPRDIVLLALHVESNLREANEWARAHDAALAYTHGELSIFAFPWALFVSEGIRLAGRMAETIRHGRGLCGPAVIHTARLASVRGKRGMRLFGPALVDRGWASPGTADTDIWLTRDAARSVPGHSIIPGPEGYYRSSRGHLPDDDIHPERITLQGRDELLRALSAEVARCVDQRIPTLSTIEGAPGLGKTRVLHALAVDMRAIASARVLYLRTRSAHGSTTISLYRELCLAVLALHPDAVTMDELAGAWARLGIDLDDAERFSAAFLVGAAPRGTPGLEPIMRAPGALRQAAARALSRMLSSVARARPLLLLLDDMHVAEHTILDALELATLDRSDVALGVWVAAQPSLFSRRPRWGDRACAGAHHSLQPLERDHSHAMLAELLRPVELIPAAVLARLSELTGGVPAYLAELARAVRSSGAIHRRSSDAPGDTESVHYLAFDELLDASNTPIVERMARQMLDAIPPLFTPLVQLCAIIGGEFERADIAGVQDVLGTDLIDRDFHELDPAFALPRLVQAGLLRPSANGYALRFPLLGSAIETLTPATRRIAFHRAILQDWQTRTRTRMPISRRLAYHAAQCGETDLAASLYLTLAHDARDHHRYVDAEELYTRALEHLPDGDPGRRPSRTQALAGRGSTRYRLQRHGDALEDLREARRLAEASGDQATIVALMLEQATVLDWLHDWPSSARLAEEAWPRAQSLGIPLFLASADLARGRAYFRDESRPPIDAVEYLTRAASLAADIDDHDIRVMALPLLAPALLRLDRVADAERHYDELFELCRRAGDDFHLAVAHLSRQLLWLHCQELDRNIQDLEVAVDMGRRLGNAHFERAATFNLAEYYYWLGDFPRATEMARRSRDLYLRFMSEHPMFEDHLLLARILACQGDEGARVQVAWIEQHCQVDSLPRAAKILLELVRRTLACIRGAPFDDAAWRALEEDADRHAPYEERVEIMTTAVEVLRRRGDLAAARHWLERARAVASHLWDHRLQELEQALQ